MGLLSCHDDILQMVLRYSPTLSDWEPSLFKMLFIGSPQSAHVQRMCSGLQDPRDLAGLASQVKACLLSQSNDPKLCFHLLSTTGCTVCCSAGD